MIDGDTKISQLQRLIDVPTSTVNGAVLVFNSATGRFDYIALGSAATAATGDFATPSGVVSTVNAALATLGSAAFQPSSAFATPASVTSVAGALTSHTGNTSNPHATTAAQVGALDKSSNLSDLASVASARTNLGLGSAALAATTDFATPASVTSALAPYLTTSTAAATYQTIGGMSSYLTTSTATSTYATISNLALKAPLAGPTFTGTLATAANTSTQSRAVYGLDASWVTSTDASRLPLVTLTVNGFNGQRTAATVTLDGTGTTPTTAFSGNVTVAGSATTAGITSSNDIIVTGGKSLIVRSSSNGSSLNFQADFGGASGPLAFYSQIGRAFSFQNANTLFGTTTDNGTDKLQVNGSATFTGTVTHATPATSDNSTKSATTAFVQDAIAKMTVTQVDRTDPAYDYYGGTLSNGTWKINRWDKNSAAKASATVTNNSSYSTLAAAWSSHTSLVYA